MGETVYQAYGKQTLKQKDFDKIQTDGKWDATRMACRRMVRSWYKGIAFRECPDGKGGITWETRDGIILAYMVPIVEAA